MTIPIIPKPAKTLPALREAVSRVAPSRLREFFEGIQDAFVQAGEGNSTAPIHLFYVKWGAIVEIERHPETARRLHAAELALNSDDREAADRAIAEIAEIVQAAHREVESS